jgi:hypothetical protein
MFVLPFSKNEHCRTLQPKKEHCSVYAGFRANITRNAILTTGFKKSCCRNRKGRLRLIKDFSVSYTKLLDPQRYYHYWLQSAREILGSGIFSRQKKGTPKGA